MGGTITFLIILVLLFAFFIFSSRTRKRQMADRQEQLQRVGPGTRVMTTSGLYATVVSRGEDTVVLEIAPGVHVTWATAALRDVQPTGGPGLPGGSAYPGPYDTPPGGAGPFGERPADGPDRPDDGAAGPAAPGTPYPHG